MSMLKRKRSGYLIAEAGPALWLIFMVFSFPLALFGSLGLRYSLLMNTVYSAAAAASQCKSFKTNTSSSDLSASNLASQLVQQAISQYPGITVSQTNSYIVIYPLGGSTSTRQSTPLTQPADISTNAYNLEVVVQAQVSPLLNYPPNGFFGNIPGLTGPISTTAKADSFFENTQGLTQ